jgi:hypothetical protein
MEKRMADPRYLAPQQRVSGPSAKVENPLYETRDVAAYAQDLVEYASKHKFLFVVRFEFNPGYEFLNRTNKLSLLVQEATRPSPQFEYDEINLYGARTQVLKKTSFSPMTITFLDDMQNDVMAFFVNALRAMSPIVNINGENFNFESNQYDFSRLGTGYNTDGGFINRSPTPPHAYPVSSGPLPANKIFGQQPTSIFKTIQLYHVYHFGDVFNQYTFREPKITSLKMDTLEMGTSDRASLTLDFSYMSFDVQLAQPFDHRVASYVGDVIFPLRRDG